MRKKHFKIILKIYIFINLFLLRTSEGIRNIEVFESDTSHVEAVEGYNASLPCAIRAPPRDSPVLTLWYVGTEETPVYSYDQRSFTSPSSWADNTVIGSRAVFLPQEHPPVLLLVNVSRSDAKTYRCRVDYNYSNSRVAWVKLSVVVPPASIAVEVYSSPVEAGQMSDVVCRVFGGSPRARVVWLQRGDVVDESYSVTGDVSINTLDVPAKREDLNELFTCSGNNNDLTQPLIATYLRNVTSGPTNVSITTEEVSLVEDKLIRFFCTVVGSNPPPKVSWFLQNNQITRYIKTISWENKTTSRLDFHLTKANHRQELLCRAQNPLLPKEILEDILILDVSYKPSVTLSLGRSLNPNHLKEGNDLFFECEIDANPPPYKIRWFHEGIPLEHNISLGVVVSVRTLALQRVDRKRSGRYQCLASSVEGDTLSNNITISILYAPRCAVPPSLRGVALGELTNVTCVVDADPQNVTFKWEFNNSVRKDTSEPVSERKYSEEGLRSTLSYTPLSERDYGTLFCSAINSVGPQKEPCSFTVISAGPPESVSNCSVGNLTSHSAGIICQQGFDGGLPQHFLLLVFEARSGSLVINETGSNPRFIAHPLESGMTFHASVIAFNSRGRSVQSSFKFRTLREAAMHKILPSKVEPSPLVWVVGVIFGIIFVVAAMLVAVWFFKRRCSYGSNRPALTTVIVKDNNPDLINMEGSEENMTDAEDTIEDNMTQKGASKSTQMDNLEQSRNIERNSYRHFDVIDTSLFPSASPDINEKTRLTSPRELRRGRPNKNDKIETRQTVVRLNRELNLSPESTF